MVFQHIIIYLSFVMFVYPYLNTIFLVLHLFSYFFIFLLLLSTFKPPNALYSKFERLKISEKTFVPRKSGVPGWGIPINRVLQNFELLNRYSLIDQIWKWIDIKNKLNLTKIRGATMVISPQTGPPKFKAFNI